MTRRMLILAAIGALMMTAFENAPKFGNEGVEVAIAVRPVLLMVYIVVPVMCLFGALRMKRAVLKYLHETPSLFLWSWAIMGLAAPLLLASVYLIHHGMVLADTGGAVLLAVSPFLLLVDLIAHRRRKVARAAEL